jgi:hypothetical protein
MRVVQLLLLLMTFLLLYFEMKTTMQERKRASLLQPFAYEGLEYVKA